jgi:hypothetical protein
MRIMPLFTTTPSKIRKPVRVFALNRLLPVNINAINEPIAARGTENMSTTGVVSDSNTDARIIRIRMNAAAMRK